MAAQAQQSDTVRVSEFGIFPDSYENQTIRLQEAIQACKEQGAKVLAFEPGRYDIWPEGAVRREYFISNTSSEEECPSKVKTLGVLFDGMEGLTIDGNGCTLMFHGKMTMVTFDRCKDMTLTNIHLDFERPGGSEITYSKVSEGEVIASFHKDSKYAIKDGKTILYGEGWKSVKTHCIEYDPDSRRFFFSQGWNVLSQSPASEIAPGTVLFKTPEGFRPKVGNTLTVRDIIRDQVGMFLLESEGIELRNVYVHYMHGLGIISQYSKDITMDNVSCAPRDGNGRILASSADFMHFSGCSGKISILGCNFAGAQDDPINVHGTNLRAVEKIDDKTLVLRFMHPQSYGYNAFFEGDEVAFVRASRMERFASAIVTSVERLSERTVKIGFDRAVPEDLEIGHDCVENMTCTPEVEIRGCRFTRTSTRGTLMTTPRKVVISGNVYEKTGMSAILIEGDAEGWYESGPVNDVLIENNIFIDCAYSGGPEKAVIALHPSNTIIDKKHPVHKNVRIVGNTFYTHGNPVLYAKSTEGLVFEGNTVSLLPEATDLRDLFILTGCSKVKIEGNTLPENR